MQCVSVVLGKNKIRVRKAKTWLDWHYGTLLEFDPSSLSIQGLFTRSEIEGGASTENNKH